MPQAFINDKSAFVLGAVRQHAITWANVDPDLCRYMASLGHNKLNSIISFANVVDECVVIF